MECIQNLVDIMNIQQDPVLEVQFGMTLDARILPASPIF